MRFYIVDAFTETPFGGNTAGVVLIPEGEDYPSEAWMRQVAAELRYSETAFVRQEGPSEFTVRYFTPRSEIDLCGHATIATFGMLFQEGVLQAGKPCINHTRAGDLEILPGPTVMMQMAAPRRLACLDDPELWRAMGIPREALAELPTETVSTGLPDIILPMRDLEALQALQPDMEALARLSERLDVVGVHAFAADAAPGEAIHVRNFAPRYAIPEESATGTANAALTYYLYLHGWVADGGHCTFIQGEAMGRPSIIHARLDLCDGVPDIRVGGPSAIVAKGSLEKPVN